MGGHVVDGGADAPREASIPAQGGRRVALLKEPGRQEVEVPRGHTGAHAIGEVLQAFLGNPACAANPRDVDGCLETHLRVHAASFIALSYRGRYPSCRTLSQVWSENIS